MFIVAESDAEQVTVELFTNYPWDWFLVGCRLFLVRGKIYELLVNCIPPEVILKVGYVTFFWDSEILHYLAELFMQHVTYLCDLRTWCFDGSWEITCHLLTIILQKLVDELMRKLDSELKHEVCHWAAVYVRSLILVLHDSSRLPL